MLNNLEERSYNEDIYNIWNHVLDITKDEFDDMLTELSYYIEDYLHKYEHQRYYHFGNKRSICAVTKYRIWYKSMHDMGVALWSTDMKHILNFYNLVKGGETIDEIKNYIYVSIKYDTLKNYLFIEHKNIFTERMKNPQRLDI